jgi:hypothetical protein
VTSGAPIRVTGRGHSISLAQAGCYINFHDDDVLAVFDAVSAVLADNRKFAENHQNARHSRSRERRERRNDAEASAS